MAWNDNPRKPFKVFVMGIDGSGKTSFLQKVKGETSPTAPTKSINLETMHFRDVDIICWDVSHKVKIIPEHYHNYCPGTDGVIYVIDSHDTEQLDESIGVFKRLIIQRPELNGTVVMVLANKQDLGECVTPGDIEAKIQSISPKGSKLKLSVFVMPCSVTSGDGVEEAFAHFVDLMKMKRQRGVASTGFIQNAWETVRKENKKKNFFKSAEYSRLQTSLSFFKPFHIYS